jgi:hypothetical protein
MKRLRCILTACAIVAASHITLAGTPNTNEVLNVVLDLSDGSRLIGTPVIASVPVQTAYAKMDVPLTQIQSLKIGDDHETVTLNLLNGDKLTGVISRESHKLETVFGNVSVGIEHIRSFRVTLSSGALPKQLREGLIAYYRFNGNANDASGNGRHGSPSNVVLTNDAMGCADSAYYFNGVNAKVDCGNLIKGVTAWTVCARIRVDSFTHRAYMGPWGQQEFVWPPGRGNTYAMFTSPGKGSFGGSWGWTDESPIDTRIDHSLPLGEWRLITQTYDGVSVRQYDNGSLINECRAHGKTLGSECSFLIGSVAAYPGNLCRTWFHGCIDEVLVYNREISAQEILELYSNMAPVSVPENGFRRAEVNETNNGTSRKP